jgi:N-acetylglucosaminyl-diphospho-decaprenol L-rhamnosyltransferase
VKRLSIITVNYGTPVLAIACIESLTNARAFFDRMEVIVVDGGSNDDSAQILANRIAERDLRDWVELLPLPINGGFAFANNRALLTLAQRDDLPEYIALINPDARATPGALEALATTLDRVPEAGAVGALLIHEDGRPQGSAFRFPTLLSEFCRGARTGAINRIFGQPLQHIVATEACQVPWVTGAAVMFRTAALQSAGLFDEGFFLYFEETELMWRMHKAGWQIWHEPAARVVHAGGVATKIRDPETGNALPKRMPRYWYEARRRFFALVGGPIYALAAGLAWLLGHFLWQMRRVIGGLPDSGTLYPARDLTAFGLWPGSRVAVAAVPDFTSEAPSTPFWMQIP